MSQVKQTRNEHQLLTFATQNKYPLVSVEYPVQIIHVHVAICFSYVHYALACLQAGIAVLQPRSCMQECNKGLFSLIWVYLGLFQILGFVSWLHV